MLIESFFLSEVFCYRLVTSAFLSLFFICFLFSGCPAYGLWGVFGLQFQNLFTGQFSSGQPSGEHPSAVTFLKVGFSPSLSFYPNNLAVFQLHLFISQTLLSMWLSLHKMAARRARVANGHKAWKLQKKLFTKYQGIWQRLETFYNFRHHFATVPHVHVELKLGFCF